MTNIKLGNFLKELRKEKGLTQEQFAEQFYVSSRTVSRWETGNNVPDLDILIDLADFYSVDIRELVDGERKKDGVKRQSEKDGVDRTKYVVLDKEFVEKTIKSARKLIISMWILVAGLVVYFFIGEEFKGVFFDYVPDWLSDAISWPLSIAGLAFAVDALFCYKGLYGKIKKWFKNKRKQ